MTVIYGENSFLYILICGIACGGYGSVFGCIGTYIYFIYGIVFGIVVYRNEKKQFLEAK